MATFVCGVDHSPGARAAALFAADLANRLARRLVLVHAFPPPIPQDKLGMASRAADWDVIDALRGAGTNLLEELEEVLSPGPEVVTELKLGDAGNVIAAAAERHRARFPARRV
jgi:nucleotide-binding universal stress UspA family protein